MRFRRDVLKHMPLVVELGYQPEEMGNSDEGVFNKELTTGVLCCIRFQSLSRFIPPDRWFEVDLSRIRLSSFAGTDDQYTPLIIPLRGLLQGYYDLGIFPPGKVTWSFTDDQEFYEELGTIENL